MAQYPWKMPRPATLFGTGTQTGMRPHIKQARQPRPKTHPHAKPTQTWSPTAQRFTAALSRLTLIKIPRLTNGKKIRLPAAPKTQNQKSLSKQELPTCVPLRRLP